MAHKIYLLFALCLLFTVGRSQQVLPLYPAQVPNSKQASNQETVTPNKAMGPIVQQVSEPTLEVFLPPLDIASGTAVVICPGGGYHALLIKREGQDIARELNKKGVAAFVLKYRLPDDRTMLDKSIGPIQDAQKAIQTVRQRAQEWHINPDKIGIMGFSAGGHLAATAGTHFNHAFIENKLNTSLRPDFMILIYPVISFTDSIGHIGSRTYLLGAHPSKDQIEFYSNELQVNNQTPPAFLVHAIDDIVVPSKNSLYFYEALRSNGVKGELHLYEKGEHGFLTAPPFDEWFGRVLYWLKENKLIDEK
ncbi:MAG: alpha/beta hydrolase [Ginsengibacter sp.]